MTCVRAGDSGVAYFAQTPYICYACNLPHTDAHTRFPALRALSEGRVLVLQNPASIQLLNSVHELTSSLQLCQYTKCGTESQAYGQPMRGDCPQKQGNIRTAVEHGKLVR